MATFDQSADEWQTTPAYTSLGERTRERYDANLRVHLRPRFGSVKLQDIDGDDVAALVAELTADGKAAWTVRNVLTTLRFDPGTLHDCNRRSHMGLR